MLIYRKNGKVFEILAMPYEEVTKGEYIIVEDNYKNYKLLLQVVDINYIDVPGLLEELLREGVIKNHISNKYDPYNVSETIQVLRDSKLLICIARGVIQDDIFNTSVSELPSRTGSKISKIAIYDILRFFDKPSSLSIKIGLDYTDKDVYINAENLDGSLSLITGMKGMGKSHLAKLLVINLVKYGAPVLVLDLNSEYIGLADEEEIVVYTPGENLFFNPQYLGRETFLNVMMHVLELPGVSANIFNELWPLYEKNGLSIQNMIELTNKVINNMMIRDAIISRLLILKSMSFISENFCTKLENIIKPGNGAIIILRGLSSIEKKVLVEMILSKLVFLLERGQLPPLFLFAEEAHMYIRDTYWEDIITRMRHFGLYVTFITNQPDSINHQIFRQIDNIFIFRFLNDHDLEMISKVSNVDSQTIKSLACELPLGSCLIVGKVVNNIPIITKVSSLPIKVLGESRKVFSVNDGVRY